MKINVHASMQMLENLLNSMLDTLDKTSVQGERLPPLYSSGFRYIKSDPGEQWQLPFETAGRMGGDCEDLSLYRAHELRLAGYPAKVRVYKSGPRILHAVVDRGDGQMEDPSRALGMGAPGMGADPTMFPPPAPWGGAGAGLPPVMPIDPMTAVALQLLASPAGQTAVRSITKKFRKWW